MAATPLKSYLARSLDLLRRNTAKVVKMDATPEAVPQTIFSFSQSQTQPQSHINELSDFGHGADAEMGGLSTSTLALVPSTSTSSGEASSSYMAFYGHLSTRVPPAQAGKIRTGYAGFRNTSRPTMFGQDTWDLELYSHLKVVVGYRGWEGWRNRWVVNIGIDGRPKTDVFQHRLEIPPSATSTSSRMPLDPLAPPLPEFATVHLPLSSFVLIRKGQIAPSSIPMPRNEIRTVGFALLGRDRGDDGPESSNPVSNSVISRVGGWGKATAEEAETDTELRALLEEDGRLGAQSQTPTPASQPTSAGSGGYHRIGSSSTAPAAQVSRQSPLAIGAQVGEEKEGYYELCVKSVEAVKWDPELEL